LAFPAETYPKFIDHNACWNPVARDGRFATSLRATPIGENRMGMLMMAVVEITTLVATCHASVPTKTVLPRDPRKRLRRDLKRGAVAYIDALSITWPNPLRDLSLLDIQGDSRLGITP
jgi:hypothetical protein